MCEDNLGLGHYQGPHPHVPVLSINNVTVFLYTSLLCLQLKTPLLLVFLFKFVFGFGQWEYHRVVREEAFFV